VQDNQTRYRSARARVDAALNELDGVLSDLGSIRDEALRDEHSECLAVLYNIRETLTRRIDEKHPQRTFKQFESESA
jgi:hypothetical protein